RGLPGLHAALPQRCQTDLTHTTEIHSTVVESSCFPSQTGTESTRLWGLRPTVLTDGKGKTIPLNTEGGAALQSPSVAQRFATPPSCGRNKVATSCVREDA